MCIEDQARIDSRPEMSAPYSIAYQYRDTDIDKMMPAHSYRIVNAIVYPGI